MSWCPIDSSYLLTCAKDNRTICWDTVSGEVWHILLLPESQCISVEPFLFSPYLHFLSFSFQVAIAIISDGNNSFLKKIWTFCLDCLWIASKHQLEFRCTLVSKNTRSYIGIFFWWKNWHLQYWGIPHCLICNCLFSPNIWFFRFSIKGSVASNGM